MKKRKEHHLNDDISIKYQKRRDARFCRSRSPLCSCSRPVINRGADLQPVLRQLTQRRLAPSSLANIMPQLPRLRVHQQQIRSTSGLEPSPVHISSRPFVGWAAGSTADLAPAGAVAARCIITSRHRTEDAATTGPAARARERYGLRSQLKSAATAGLSWAGPDRGTDSRPRDSWRGGSRCQQAALGRLSIEDPGAVEASPSVRACNHKCHHVFVKQCDGVLCVRVEILL